MPMKPKRPCSYPGCPNLTDRQYCEMHQKEMNRQYEKYDRNPLTKKRYSGAWVRIRKQYAEAHPFCEICFENGIITPVEHVHHKLPLNEGGTNDFDNLQSLCKSCHSRLHMKRGDNFKNIPKK
ncbi:MAG: HNH endonuclease [Lachnospiraceae bacterium]|jgi:5-methylcytosine-specific restriction protein A|nr:HNH endonuclease [Lachnospiraceae bacterium]